MIGNDQILTALRVIKETCEAQDECYKCPLADSNYNCVVSNHNAPEPANWEIKNNAPEDIWRAFEEEA